MFYYNTMKLRKSKTNKKRIERKKEKENKFDKLFMNLNTRELNKSKIKE